MRFFADIRTKNEFTRSIYLIIGRVQVRHQFPWKLALQVFKIIIVTAQVLNLGKKLILKKVKVRHL